MDDRADDILLKVIRLRGGERRAFLEQLSSADPPLANRVRTMLAAFEQSDAAGPAQTSATSAPAPNGASVSTSAPAGATIAPGTSLPPNMMSSAPITTPIVREEAGSMIGPYKILQEIGEGGFGFVYMAQQSAPIKRKVAIKIVKPGMDTRQVIGRFEAERQALAMMDHPNIAKVFDAGATPAGRPYFVMELVKGEPITEYCDKNQLTTKQRLDLFIAVCHAVLHAHQKGIIHRDLKPSNVMVTLHDGEPVPKVIDFGIAKATGQELTDKTVFTEYRNFIGTPEYMSPEQAAMSGLDIDTRSDIYSLGVLLYELLTGTTPLDATILRGAGYAEIQRIIQEDEPPKPSTRVHQTLIGKSAVTGTGKSTTAEQVAKHRRTDVTGLRRALSGDLDWIVMKALEKDRTRRYSTCSDLADDVRRFLHNEPIAARPPSTAYKMRKFARRNRAVLATAGVVLAALVLTLAALAYSIVQVSHERDMTAQRMTAARAEMLLSAMNSVRKYTADKVRPALVAAQADHPDFVKESVPGFSALQVFNNFKTDEKFKTYTYKEASLNPTNVKNLADDFETKILQDYRSGAKTGDQIGFKETESGTVYWIARPMAIASAKCLDCHTTPDMAPAKQVAEYGRDHGFGWKMNEIVAAQMVYVPVSAAFRADPTSTYWLIGTLSAVFLCIAGGLVLVLRKA